MIQIDRKRAGLMVLIVVLIFAAIWSAALLSKALSPVRVGVLLPVEANANLVEPLAWAAENINREGGINGRPLELVYADTSGGDLRQPARDLLRNPDITFVIGPFTTDEAFEVAPLFIERKKVLISPSSTGGDLIRAFGKTGYFWRTSQGDVEQVRALMGILSKQKAGRVAVLVENTTNGKTFYDWAGFFAAESGLEVTSIRQFEHGGRELEGYVRDALAGVPDYLVVVAVPEDTARVRRAMKQSGTGTKLFVANSGDTAALVQILGSGAEGIEGIRPASDPSTGFSVAYDEKFRHAPDAYAAPLYDAVLLAAYTTARQEVAWAESPADSVRAIVYGSGAGYGWDAQGIRQTLQAIRNGTRPEVHGAGGPLDYDTEFGVDPLVAYFEYGVIEEGAFRVSRIVTSEKMGAVREPGVSAARYRASQGLMALPSAGTAGESPLQNRTGFWAVIVGPSDGWENYRHQSDALAMYTLLRKNGVPDDHIILMIYDDIPDHPQNPIRGDVHNVPKGENLRPAAEADYTGSLVTGETLMDVLLGNRTPRTPVVLDSNSSTDVFVYIASHGMPEETVFSPGGAPLTADQFTSLTETMEREGRYRRLVFLVDTCFGESIARNATAQGMLYITGASASEPSLGAVYDMDIRQWLSDEFTATVLDTLHDHPGITFRDLYITTYERVTGSHVRMLNAENFGNIDVPVMEFLQP